MICQLKSNNLKAFFDINIYLYIFGLLSHCPVEFGNSYNADKLTTIILIVICISGRVVLTIINIYLIAWKYPVLQKWVIEKMTFANLR